MKPRLLILGVDGADPHIIEKLRQQGAMPHLDALARQGCLCALPSTIPPTTFPAWTSFFTGTTPSVHGVTDFTVRRGYAVRFTGAGQRRTTTFLRHLSNCGSSVGAAWFPATYPPESVDGWQVSGWDSPVTDRGDASFVFPPPLHRELLSQFGRDHLQFNAIDEFADRPGWYEDAAAALVRRVHRRAQMAAWLLAHHPVDVAAFYFGETDTVAHHFFACHDPQSPRRPAQVSPTAAAAVENVYRAVDEALGLLQQTVSSDTAIIVVSDHGSSGNSDIVVHLNRFLAEEGLLQFKKSPSLLSRLPLSRALPARLIPGFARRRAFQLMGGLFPSLYESALRFSGIDFPNTSAFSEELPYAPAIWVNQLGRDPRGTVKFRDIPRIQQRIEDGASRWRHANGTPVIAAIHPRAALHDGPLAHRFPDFILQLSNVNGYQPVCLSSRGHPGPSLSRLSPDEYGGRKGCSMPGGHGPSGIFACSRADVAMPGSLHEATSIVCRLAGAPPMENGASPLSVPTTTGYTAREEQIVAARLRRLGYLED